jgi:putative ABC transport system permease protein
MINICGLALSLMFVVLISVYTVQEMSTDSFQAKADRIYIFSNAGGENEDFNSFYGTAYRISDRLTERYPEIESACPMAPMDKVAVSVNDMKYSSQLLCVDSTFFSMFSFRLSEGDPSTVLREKYNAVISETFARKVFPDTNPVGQRLAFDDSLTLTVAGVMKDNKHSVVKEADIIIRIDNVGAFNSSMDDSKNYGNAGSAVIFLLERAGANLTARTDDMAAYLKEFFWFYSHGLFTKVELVPLKDAYFRATIEGGHLLNLGNRSFVLILLSVGALILIFAVINYINLTAAQAGFRAKEMATRRLLGSSRWELFARLVYEATLLSAFSFAIGVFLAFACEPYASYLLEKDVDIAAAVSPVSIAACIGLIFVLGLLAGIIPAFIISNVKPVDAMKGTVRTRNKMVFGKIFITFQNVITIAMIAASITMVLQTEHLIKAPLGYRTENIIHVKLSGETGETSIRQRLADELRRMPCVTRLSFCKGTPYTRGNNNTMTYEGRNISVQSLIGDSAYFNLLGLEVIRDNNLSDSSGPYFNEYAFQELNISMDASSIVLPDGTEPIAGIVKDFQLQDILYRQHPVRIYIVDFNKERSWWTYPPTDLLVEVAGNPAEAFGQVRHTFERVTAFPFEGEFIDSQVAESFAALRRTSTIVTLFGLIATVISVLGLLAMAKYYVRQRSREIAVRKVFGSANREMLARILSTFMLYVCVAFVIATPVIWYIMRGWLSDYSYRIPLSPMIFIGAGLFCLLVSFVSVVWQSYAAANANPIDTFKVE